ncbi:hypothetical protein vBBaMIFTN8_52 [Bordetella phage vB_BaM-IFTN8]|nr:hypothetical protein vBBaMIFTN8_52 [Bordetella phage vB_BaM-IFTN8]
MNTITPLSQHPSPSKPPRPYRLIAQSAWWRLAVSETGCCSLFGVQHASDHARREGCC